MSAVKFRDSKRELLRGLYVITDERLGGHLEVADAALAGGAKIIQLRDKSTPVRELIVVALEMRRLTREAGALLIINDRVDLALLCEADGVHLGPDDWPVAAALKIAPELILGASCGTPEEARTAEWQGADYIGCGAVYGTLTKKDAGDAIGIDGLSAVVSATSLPVAAIGGINKNNLVPVLETGAEMVCVVSAIAGAGNFEAMKGAAEAICRRIQSRA